MDISFFTDLTPNGTETEELLADAYAVKRNQFGNNDNDDEMTRVDEGPNDIEGEDEMGDMNEQTLTEGELSDSGDSLEGATLTPTKPHESHREQPTNERENLVSSGNSINSDIKMKKKEEMKMNLRKPVVFFHMLFSIF